MMPSLHVRRPRRHGQQKPSVSSMRQWLESAYTGQRSLAALIQLLVSRMGWFSRKGAMPSPVELPMSKSWRPQGAISGAAPLRATVEQGASTKSMHGSHESRKPSKLGRLGRARQNSAGVAMPRGLRTKGAGAVDLLLWCASRVVGSPPGAIAPPPDGCVRPGLQDIIDNIVVVNRRTDTVSLGRLETGGSRMS